MTSEYEVIKLRLEALKMAYETCYNMGILQKTYHVSESGKVDVKIKEDLEDVFTLADINMNYFLEGEHPYEEQSGTESE